MNIKDFAETLNRKEYFQHPLFTKEELQIAKDNGFVIVYGASDDLMEFDGSMYDEVGCYEGGSAYVKRSGIFTYRKPKCKAIHAVWCDKNRTDAKGRVIPWTYKTKIPHETFMIYEDEEPYCEGIVFKLDDIV